MIIHCYNPKCISPGEEPGTVEVGRHVWNTPSYCDKCKQWEEWCGVCGEHRTVTVI